MLTTMRCSAMLCASHGVLFIHPLPVRCFSIFFFIGLIIDLLLIVVRLYVHFPVACAGHSASASRLSLNIFVG